MSRCYYVECENGFVNLDFLKKYIQEVVGDDFKIQKTEVETENGEVSILYVENKSIRGIQISKEAEYIVVQFNILGNLFDFYLGKIVLKILSSVLFKPVLDEAGLEIDPDEFFTKEKVQEMREQDALTMYKAIETAFLKEQRHVEIPGVVRSYCFGPILLENLSDMKDKPEALADYFEGIMRQAQYDAHTDCQNHGDHWKCIMQNVKDEIIHFLPTVFHNAGIHGWIETDYVLDKQEHGKVIELTYANDADDPIITRGVVAENGDTNVLVSMYPFVKDGTVVEMKLTEIREWETGLEAWVTGEIDESREITFFDADYAIHKKEYEVGKTYKFMIGALAYIASEPESKGFSFEGQQAIDFKAKLGEKPDYDENGTAMPIIFSTAKLCSFLQIGRVPDEAEFVSTVKEVETVTSFGKQFWKFVVKYSVGGDNEILIPTFIKKTPDNEALGKAPQIQGLLWVTGCMVGETVK